MVGLPNRLKLTLIRPVVRVRCVSCVYRARLGIICLFMGERLDIKFEMRINNGYVFNIRSNRKISLSMIYLELHGHWSDFEMENSIGLGYYLNLT